MGRNVHICLIVGLLHSILLGKYKILTTLCRKQYHDEITWVLVKIVNETHLKNMVQDKAVPIVCRIWIRELPMEHLSLEILVSIVWFLFSYPRISHTYMSTSHKHICQLICQHICQLHTNIIYILCLCEVDIVIARSFQHIAIAQRFGQRTGNITHCDEE